jgi:hypothetical protein
MPRLTIKHALMQELSLSRRRKVPLLPELQNPVIMVRAAKNRPRDGRYAQRYDALRGVVSHSHRGRIRRFHNRRPPRNLAHSQQTFPNMDVALLLPGDRRGRERSGDQVRRSTSWKHERSSMARNVRSTSASRKHGGRIYLDLADEQWRAVDIGPDGWRVVECPPVRFRRPAGILPLSVPERGGSIAALNSFLNLASRNDFVLIVAWLLAALRAGGPYPLLAISGEQGSAKTVLSKLRFF